MVAFMLGEEVKKDS